MKLAALVIVTPTASQAGALLEALEPPLRGRTRPGPPLTCGGGSREVVLKLKAESPKAVTPKLLVAFGKRPILSSGPMVVGTDPCPEEASPHSTNEAFGFGE